MNKYLISAALIVSLILCTSCGDGVIPNESDTGNADKVSIYFLGPSDMNIYDIAIDKFNSENGEELIEPVRFDDNKEFESRIAIEIMAGEGPDILTGYAYLFEKFKDKDVLFDMNSFLNTDEEFDSSDFFKNVFEYGIVDGKRLFFPLNFRIPAFWATDNMKKLIEFNFDKNLTWNDLGNISDIVNSKNEKRSKKMYLFDKFWHWRIHILETEIYNYIDFGKKTHSLDSNSFMDFLKNFKKVNTAACPIQDYGKFKDRENDMISNDQVIFVNFFKSLSPYNKLKYITEKFPGEEITVYNFPVSSQNGQINTLADSAVGILNTCSEKETAYTFIKSLLSYSIQQLFYYPLTSCLPINRNVYVDRFINYSDEEKDDEEAKDLLRASFPFLDELRFDGSPQYHIRRPIEIIEGSGKPISMDKEILRPIFSIIGKYLYDVCSLTETIDELSNMVELMLNE